jgi:hypothetical protein
MKKVFLISLLFPSLTLFSTLATAQFPAFQKEGEAHEHKTMEIPEGQPVPSVDLVVYPDTMKGWNLQVKLTNFKFAPEKINQASTLGEGHAHLYVNGKKITRLYSNWYYLENLEPGRNEIQVALNANTHEAFIYDGKAIADTEIVEVK